MPTFGDLRTRLREDVLAENDTGFYSDADLLEFLSEASIEIASLGGFPATTSTSAVASGTLSVTAPSDISFIGPRNGVSFASLPLRYKDFSVIQLHQGHDGQTRYYNYDPRLSTTIELAPATHEAGSLVVKYVQDLSNVTYSAGDTPWNGTLENWNDTIVYFAGVKAYERGYEYDKAQYWKQRLQDRLQSFAYYLDNDSVLNVVSMVNNVPAEGR